MMVVFSNKPKNLGSKLISLFTRKRGQKLIQVPSHVSLVFYDTLMIEAVIGDGVRLNFKPTFLKKNNVVAMFKYNARVSDHLLYRKVAEVFHGKSYDYKGMIWFAIVIVKSWITGKKIPAINRLQSDHRAFCSEVLSIILDESTSHVAPNQLMMDIEKDERFTKV